MGQILQGYVISEYFEDVDHWVYLGLGMVYRN
jgi:hypothetical protein